MLIIKQLTIPIDTITLARCHLKVHAWSTWIIIYNSFKYCQRFDSRYGNIMQKYLLY